MVNTFTILKLSTHYEINGDRTRMNLVMLWQCSSGILCIGVSTPYFLPSLLLHLQTVQAPIFRQFPSCILIFLSQQRPSKTKILSPPAPFFWKFGRFNHPAERGERGECTLWVAILTNTNSSPLIVFYLQKRQSPITIFLVLVILVIALQSIPTT